RMTSIDIIIAGGLRPRRTPLTSSLAGTPSPRSVRSGGHRVAWPHSTVIFVVPDPSRSFPVVRERSRSFLLVGGVRHQGDLARALDRRLERALMRRAHAGEPARLDLAPLRNERRQEFHVLVADVVDLLDAEHAHAPAAEKRAASALVLVVLLVLAA